MKKIINILGLLFGLIIVLTGFLIADHYGPLLGFSGLPKTIFSFAGALPGILILFIFDDDYQKNLHWLLKPVARSVWVWRLTGTFVAITGGGLALGNQSGQFLTFPYSGQIIIVIGILILSFKGSTNSANEPSKIPLTIGFANLSGDDLSSMAAKDAAALSPLFARSRVVPAHQIPSAEILFVYAHLNEDGTIKGPTHSGIRQVVQLTNAPIVVLASPNSGSSIQNAATLPGPKTANIVFTLDRNGDGLSQFFCELFEKMRDGKHMLSAWVEIAPQTPEGNHAHAPQTILLAEGGKIAFPR